MNTRSMANTFVNLVKVYRNGQQEITSMPRWVAELEIGCIPQEQPEVARARIEPIQIDPQAAYPRKRIDPVKMRDIALYMAEYLAAPLVA